MTGHIYRDVILEQHVRLFSGAMGVEFLFMDDNARPHCANIVDECLQSEDITRINWPAYSPDLNPIEHVKISALHPPDDPEGYLQYANWGPRDNQLLLLQCGLGYLPTTENCFASGFELITSNSPSLKEFVILDKTRQVGQIGEPLVIRVKAIQPLEDAGKNRWTIVDFGSGARRSATEAWEYRLIVRSAVAVPDTRYQPSHLQPAHDAYKESRFQLYPGDNRRCVWKRKEQRADPAFTIASRTGPHPRVMVCDLISLDSQTHLVPHLQHSERSPDLSPIEHVWDMMGLHLPVNYDDPARHLEHIWQEIPQETIRVSYHSRPRLWQLASRLEMDQHLIELVTL
ncbi:transposable element Tcb2 transposase [Trichonephila clavipes]|nr:transposable element Tcb2 transposase [Trichonephila clavipes]